MKISRNQLLALINEVGRESHSVLFEAPDGGDVVGQEQTGDYTKDPDEYDGDIAKKQLFHMGAQAQQLHDMVGEDVDLDPWIQKEITNAATSLEKAFKAIIYDKQNPKGR
jgi:hypothetical protein